MSDNDIYVSVSEEGGSYFVIVDEVRYKCSYAEASILETLLQNKDDYYSREELAAIGWPGKLVSKNSVPVSIANLRKIFKNHTQLDVITNEKNKGYVVVEDKVKLLAGEVDTKADSEATATATATQVENAPQVQPASEVVLDTDVVDLGAAGNTAEKDTSPSKLKRMLAKALTYPLLAFNIAFLLFISFYETNEVPISTLNVISEKDYVAVITSNNGSTLTNFLPLEGKPLAEYNDFTSLESVVSTAVEQDKPVFIINSHGERVVVDCLRNQQVISFSGNDIEVIHSELEKQGCKL